MSFGRRPASRMFREEASFNSVSLLSCAADCASATGYSRCAAIYLEGPVCHCGEAKAAFAKGPPLDILVNRRCRHQAISGIKGNVHINFFLISRDLLC